jgi:hypothetical protein
MRQFEAVDQLSMGLDVNPSVFGLLVSSKFHNNKVSRKAGATANGLVRRPSLSSGASQSTEEPEVGIDSPRSWSSDGQGSEVVQWRQRSKDAPMYESKISVNSSLQQYRSSTSPLDFAAVWKIASAAGEWKREEQERDGVARKQQRDNLDRDGCIQGAESGMNQAQLAGRRQVRRNSKPNAIVNCRLPSAADDHGLCTKDIPLPKWCKAATTDTTCHPQLSSVGFIPPPGLPPPGLFVPKTTPFQDSCAPDTCSEEAASSYDSAYEPMKVFVSNMKYGSLPLNPDLPCKKRVPN